MVLVRDRVDHHVRVRVHRGVTRADASGRAEITHAAAGARRALWAFGALDSSDAILAAAPEYVTDGAAIETAAPLGATSLRIVSPEVYVLYVRPPAGAWYYDATDGSRIDGDGTQNGTVQVPLSSLERLEQGPKPPPERVESGDYVLIIDPRGVRSAKVVVP
jgi:hypothetical protein